jgi:hypothetical protein
MSRHFDRTWFRGLRRHVDDSGVWRGWEAVLAGRIGGGDVTTGHRTVCRLRSNSVYFSGVGAIAARAVLGGQLAGLAAAAAGMDAGHQQEHDAGLRRGPRVHR